MKGLKPKGGQLGMETLEELAEDVATHPKYLKSIGGGGAAKLLIGGVSSAIVATWFDPEIANVGLIPEMTPGTPEFEAAQEEQEAYLNECVKCYTRKVSQVSVETSWWNVAQNAIQLDPNYGPKEYQGKMKRRDCLALDGLYVAISVNKGGGVGYTIQEDSWLKVVAMEPAN